MNTFKGKKIAVIGLGIEGVSSAEYLAKHGAVVTKLDQTQGVDYLKNLSEFDIIVRSPGIKRDLPQVQEAEKNGAIITSQTKLFFDLCPCPIIGVTGTKGKGTTSSLIYEMLKEQGFKAYLGGNIGQPPFTFLDKLTAQSYVVLELSSFQLQDITKSPHIGVVLMVTQEHLAPDKKDSPDQNYHTSLEDYIEAKRNILRFQTSKDFAIVNRDYPASHESDILTEGKVFQVSTERQSPQGCYVFGDKILLQQDGNVQEIIDTKDIFLPGRHNFENVCAAVMAARLAGVSTKAMMPILKTFKGLEHRLELVAEVNGVKYYDDSFSTTPETAIAAIQAFKNPEILILGGAHKGSNFEELGNVIAKAENIKAIIGIGVEWERIKDKIYSSSEGAKRLSREVESRKSSRQARTINFQIIENCKDMKQIAQAAFEAATPGDVVLLSPACSSFDMFKNYKERGDQFKKEVNKLISNS